MIPLTEKQLAFVRLVWAFRRDKGRPATLREIAKRLKVAIPTAWESARALVKKGALAHEGKGRGGRAFLSVPQDVSDALGLLEHRHERLRAQAALVVRGLKCGTPCYGDHERCAALEEAALALERRWVLAGVL